LNRWPLLDNISVFRPSNSQISAHCGWLLTMVLSFLPYITLGHDAEKTLPPTILLLLAYLFLCVSMCIPYTITWQWLGKHIPMAMNTCVTIQELLAVFSV
jgi:hypothetical protein